MINQLRLLASYRRGATLRDFCSSKDSELQSVLAATKLISDLKQLSNETYNDERALSEILVSNLRKMQFTEAIIKEYQGLFDPHQGVVLPKYLKIQKRIIDGTNED